MTNYFNEAAYKRWLRQYLVNLDRFIENLNILRVRMDDLPPNEEAWDALTGIHAMVDDIDVHLDEIIPRDFSVGEEPLTNAEKFVENLKIICIGICALFKRPEPFISIYQHEKDRIMKEHRTFQFKEKLRALKKMIEEAETENAVTESI